MSRILFVAYGGGHVAALEPVYQAAKQAGHDVRFLALTTAQSYLQQRHIPFLRFRDLPGNDLPDVVAYGTTLASELANGPVDREESIAYLGLNFRDLVATAGQQGARDAFRAQGRQAFLPVGTMKAALEWIRPDLVLATSSPRVERATILAAGELAIPSVCIVDLFCKVEALWVGAAGFANRVCVLNSFVRDLLLAAGRDADEVVVTGNPSFDMLATTASEGNMLRLRRNWNDGRVNVLWASQVEPSAHPFTGTPGNANLPRIIETELRRIVSNRQDIRLVVRYHPSERVQFVPMQNVEFSPTSEPLAPLLHAVDIVVVMTSTVGLEAHLVGKPVVSVGGSVYDIDVPFAEFGVSLHARAVGDIDLVLDEVIRKTAAVEERASTSVREGVFDNATANVMSVINSLLS